MAKIPRTLQYFLDRVYINTNNCWVYPRVDEDGYGRCGLQDASKGGLAHCEAYRIAYGPVPPGLELDHLCRNRACCNPEHLEAVTHAVNMARGDFAQRTHCPAGHPYEGNNLYLDKNLNRRCRYCLMLQKREYRAGKRASKRRS